MLEFREMTITETDFSEHSAKTGLITDVDASEIYKKSDQLWNQDAARRARYTALAIRYYQDVYSSTDAYLSATEQSPELQRAIASISAQAPTFAIGRSHVDAAVAQLSGASKPRVQFMVTRGDWKVRRAVGKIEQFALGTMSAKCEQYPDIWAMKRDTLRDAVMFGDGVDVVRFDSRLSRATYGRGLPWEFLVDPDDAYAGNPICLFRRTRYDRASLLEAYPEHKKGIKSSPAPSIADMLWMPGLDTWVGDSLRNQVLVTEYWQLPISEKPGRHVMVTHNGTVLVDEDWSYDWFPFEFIHWTSPVIGFWGASLLEQSRKLEGWINQILDLIQRATSNSAQNILVAPIGSLADPKNAFVASNSVVEVKVKPGEPLPQVQTPQAFNPQLFDLVKSLYGTSFELAGISQMTATAQKQPGIEANAAIQTMTDLQSERLGVQWDSYQTTFTSLAKKAVMLTKDGIGDKRVRVNVPGDKFLNSVEWPSIDLEEDMFVAQLQPAPTSKWTLAGRIQQAETLGKAGVLSPQSVLRVQQFGDAPGELDILNRQDEFIERMIDRWVDSTEDQRNSNLVDPKNPSSPRLVPPVPKVLDVPRAIAIVGPAYLESLFDEVPDDILELHLQFLRLLDEALQQRRPPPAQPTAPQPQQPQQPQQVGQ